MADLPRYPDPGENTRDDPPPTTRTSLWPKVLIAVVVVLLLLMIGLHLAGGGFQH